jgi:hypothetical protein
VDSVVDGPMASKAEWDEKKLEEICEMNYKKHLLMKMEKKSIVILEKANKMPLLKNKLEHKKVDTQPKWMQTNKEIKAKVNFLQIFCSTYVLQISKLFSILSFLKFLVVFSACRTTKTP